MIETGMLVGGGVETASDEPSITVAPGANGEAKECAKNGSGSDKLSSAGHCLHQTPLARLLLAQSFRLRINEVKVHPVPMKLSEELIANPMSTYPEYREKRQSWYGPMTSAVVEISTDAGISGLGTVGGGKGKLAVTVLDEQFRALLIGRNPFDIELLWEQMFRASLFYGRKGTVIEVISGIDLALWDIVGKAVGQPVYNLIGGKTKKKIPVYVTGNLTERHLQEGFRHVKLAIPHGPAAGTAGLKKNIELVERTRRLMGPDGDIMLDCYMALDIHYAIALAKAVASLGVLWIEEPVPPDQIESYRKINLRQFAEPTGCPGPPS
jgi:L-rhamnonate dehydratase